MRNAGREAGENPQLCYGISFTYFLCLSSVHFHFFVLFGSVYQLCHASLHLDVFDLSHCHCENLSFLPLSPAPCVTHVPFLLRFALVLVRVLVFFFYTFRSFAFPCPLSQLVWTDYFIKWSGVHLQRLLAGREGHRHSMTNKPKSALWRTCEYMSFHHFMPLYLYSTVAQKAILYINSNLMYIYIMFLNSLLMCDATQLPNLFGF